MTRLRVPWVLPLMIPICALAAAGARSSQTPPTRPATIGEFLGLGARPRVIAHRGFSGVAPENSMAAFRKAIDVGADMIELDVLLSRDGALVVIHDDTLDRTTSGSGPVARFSLGDLKKLDAGSWFSADFAAERLPTLDEVLDLTRGRILVNVEIKTEAVTDDPRGGIAEKVVALVRDRQMTDRVIISSFDPRAVQQARAMGPEIRTAILYNEQLHRGQPPAAILSATGADAFNLSRREVTRAIVEACHALGRPVAVYTVNDPAEIRRLIDMGVDAMFTDWPDRLLGLIGTLRRP